VSPPGPGVCVICAAGAPRDRAMCGTCHRLSRRSTVPLGPMLPISMAPDGSGIYQALWAYKAATDPLQRAWRRGALADLIGRFLEVHGRCINEEGWDIVCTVPSLRARAGPHPLDAVVDAALHQGSPGTMRLPIRRGVLRPGPWAGATRRGAAQVDAFGTDRRAVGGRRVLLLDDVCTSGAHIQSARAAVLRAGARCVDAVVVGRRIQRWWPDNRAILEWASRAEHRWDPQRCSRCPHVRGARPGP